MDRPLSIGVIGTGFGHQVHVPAFRAVPHCQVEVICSSRLDKAQASAKALQIPSATDDWHAVISDPTIDVLAIAVPPAIQAEIALAGAQAGKHLFCEKPLALNSEQAENILAAVQRSGVNHVIDFIFPEIAAWQRAKELLSSSVIGPLRQVSLSWRVEIYAYRAKVENWKTNRQQGGGVLNNFVSHSLYYLEWLLGPITRVNAYLTPRDTEVEARVESWLEFASGVSAGVSVASDAFLGTGHRLEFYGERGTIVLENTGADYARGFELYLGTRDAPKLARVEISGDDQHADGRVYPVSRIAGRFIEAIREKKTVTPNLTDGLRVQKLLDALRLADQNDSWQSVSAIYE